MRCPPPPARGRGRLELVAGPGPWSFRPPSRSAKLLLFAAEATALQSSVCATPAEPGRCHAHRAQSGPRQRYEPRAARDGRDAGDRSEEHTSELQSRGHLVCRLLLEKKKS